MIYKDAAARVNRKKTAKSKLLFLLLVTVILLSLTFIFFINPVIGSIIELKRTAETLSRELIAMENKLQQSDEIMMKYEKAVKRERDLYQTIPHINRLSSVLKELDNFLLKTGVRVADVDVGRVIYGSRELSDYHADVLVDEMAAALPVSVILHGISYDQDPELLEFISKLEVFPYMLLIDSITWNKGREPVIITESPVTEPHSADNQHSPGTALNPINRGDGISYEIIYPVYCREILTITGYEVVSYDDNGAVLFHNFYYDQENLYRIHSFLQQNIGTPVIGGSNEVMNNVRQGIRIDFGPGCSSGEEITERDDIAGSVDIVEREEVIPVLQVSFFLVFLK